MMEDLQKETRNSQKELREKLKYELNKAIVDFQTQTRQLIESLLANRLSEDPKFPDPRYGNQSMSTFHMNNS